MPATVAVHEFMESCVAPLASRYGFRRKGRSGFTKAVDGGHSEIELAIWSRAGVHHCQPRLRAKFHALDEAVMSAFERLPVAVGVKPRFRAEKGLYLLYEYLAPTWGTIEIETALKRGSLPRIADAIEQTLETKEGAYHSLRSVVEAWQAGRLENAVDTYVFCIAQGLCGDLAGAEARALEIARRRALENGLARESVREYESAMARLVLDWIKGQRRDGHGTRRPES